MKKFLCLALAAVLLLSMSVSIFASDECVVFVDYTKGNNANDGATPDKPKKNWSAVDENKTQIGVVAPLESGGTAVIMGKSYISGNYTIPKARGEIIITSNYGGVDYKNPLPKNNPACAFKMKSGATLSIAGEVTFDDVILFQEAEQNTIIVKNGGYLKITDKIVCMSNKPYYWNIEVEKGGVAEINGGIFSNISGDGEITIGSGVELYVAPDPNAPKDGDTKVVFHDTGNGNDANTGLTPDQPLKSVGDLSKGALSKITTGGTVVTVGKTFISQNYSFPILEGPVTFTSVWNGVDYKNPEPATNPTCAFKMGSGRMLTICSDIIFDDIILFQEFAQNIIYVKSGVTLMVTDKAVLMSKPDLDYHYKIELEEGATAILSQAAMDAFDIVGDGEVIPYASSTPQSTVVKLVIDSLTGYVNGVAVPLDAAPVIRQNRTLLPIRFVAENLGATVGWDPALGAAVITGEGVEIKFVLKNGTASSALVNGVDTPFDSPAFVENGRTYMPVRFIADLLGATVDWDAGSRTATLTK